jgi:hypothetical protein
VLEGIEETCSGVSQTWNRPEKVAGPGASRGLLELPRKQVLRDTQRDFEVAGRLRSGARHQQDQANDLTVSAGDVGGRVAPPSKSDRRTRARARAMSPTNSRSSVPSGNVPASPSAIKLISRDACRPFTPLRSIRALAPSLVYGIRHTRQQREQPSLVQVPPLSYTCRSERV